MTHPPGFKWLDPSQVFVVPGDVRHLNAEQTLLLERSFDAWRDNAKGGNSLRSRERLRLIFLLLRHTGARLGEILSLDDRVDMDLHRFLVFLGRPDTRRQVPVPLELGRELARFLDGPLAMGQRGGIFRADPGYVRRIFYARAKECGVPKELATPRVLRNTRAVEMLRSGVPLAAARDALGQSSTDLTAVYQHYTRGDVTCMVRRLATSGRPLRTSARNAFAGHVSRVRTDGLMAEVDIVAHWGGELCALITMESLKNLGLEPEAPVVASIKAPLVSVQRTGGGGPGSPRNNLAAEIRTVRSTEVLAEIVGRVSVPPDAPGGGDEVEVCALVSAATAVSLDLAPGDKAEFFFKALSVVLNAI